MSTQDENRPDVIYIKYICPRQACSPFGTYVAYSKAERIEYPKITGDTIAYTPLDRYEALQAEMDKAAEGNIKVNAELANARELLREIRDNEVNPADECDRFLRDHEPSELSRVKAELQQAREALEMVSSHISQGDMTADEYATVCTSITEALSPQPPAQEDSAWEVCVKCNRTYQRSNPHACPDHDPTDP